MTLLIRTLLIQKILITLSTGAITYNDITYNWFYLLITLLRSVNNKHMWNAAFILVIGKVFISIVVVPYGRKEFYDTGANGAFQGPCPQALD